VRSAFVFLEASVELVPEEIQKHPAVVADAKRRGKKPSNILLDDSKHHSAMKGLKFREKRGRPDIIHQCLLLLLDSPVSRELEVYVHTVNGVIIRVNPETRLPRNYNRFVGLLEDLFVRRRITAQSKTLLEITDLELGEIVKGKKVILLSEKGDRRDLKELMDEEFAVCIGAFPHGDIFESTLEALNNPFIVSLGPKSYTSLYVTSKVLCEYERVRYAENC
jgi:rRNA small subunit pseudouridine methyltransferase Nep1